MKLQLLGHLNHCFLEEEEEDEVLFREKADDDGEDEGVISDYESEAEMSEEMVLEKLEKFLL